MKKRNIVSAAALSLCLTMGMTFGVSADSRKVVTLGADLSEQQRQIVMNYFGVTENEVELLTITNQDERDHLASFVPLEMIGTRTYSCAFVSPTTSGGIQVKTANLDWVTCNMIATTLSTSGVVNCDVIAASPFQVSGTGALTGIMMAYEEASGETLDPVKKELATEELVITGELADSVGQKEATSIVNNAKTEIISQNITDVTVIQNVVTEIVEQEEAQISQEELEKVTELLDKIAQQEYDYEEMKDTLQRVEENVSAMEDLTTQENQEGDAAEAGEAAQNEAAENQEETEATEETEPSILDHTNDAALGEDVIIGSTLEPETEVPETEAPVIDLVEPEVPELETEAPAETEGLPEVPELETEAPAETEGLPEAPELETEAPAETEGLPEVPEEPELETEAPVETEGLPEVPEEPELETEAPVETEGLPEAPEEPELETEASAHTEDELTEEQSLIYKQINWYMEKVLGLTGESSDSEEYNKIQEMTVTVLLAAPENAQILKEKFAGEVLDLLAEEDTETVLTEEEAARYGTLEVKKLCDAFSELIVNDQDQLLTEIPDDQKKLVCDEAESFFKSLYGVTEEAEVPAETEGSEASLEGEEAMTEASAETEVLE